MAVMVSSLNVLCCYFLLRRRTPYTLHLLQRGFPPEPASFRNRLPQCWFPHGVTYPTCKPTPVGASLCRSPQVLPGASSSTSFLQGHSLLQASTCSTMVFPGLQGGVCTGVRSPYFSSDLGVAGLIPLQVLVTLLRLLLCMRLPQPSLSCSVISVIPEALTQLLMGSALASADPPTLALALSNTREMSRSFSQKPPWSPLLPKPCHKNPMQK